MVGLVPSATPAQLNGTLPQLSPPRSGTLRYDDDFRASALGGPLEGKTLDDLRAAIVAGNIYVNIHTTEYPAGVARGQLEPQSNNSSRNSNDDHDSHDHDSDSDDDHN